MRVDPGAGELQAGLSRGAIKQDAASDLEEQLSERVRAEPIKSVLIAAAAGYLYARIFRR